MLPPLPFSTEGPLHSNSAPPPHFGESQQFGRTEFGGLIFRHNSFPVAWILVLGPKHTFLLVVV